MASYVLDANELGDLFRVRGDRLLAWFARRCWDASAAVDLTAETFAVAVAARRSFRGSCREEAEAWLFGIARNVLAGYVRSGRVELSALRRLGLQPPFAEDEDLERIERDAELAQLAAAVAEQLDALPEKQRQAVSLRVVDELPYPTIAARCGVTEQVVRARVSRGLRTLRLKLPALPTGDPS